MESEQTFLGYVFLVVILLTIATIPVSNFLRRRALERRRQHEEELQREIFRYVEEQQSASNKPRTRR